MDIINKNMYSNIVKASMAVGSNKLTNSEFIKKYNINSTAEWIEAMTGIKQRYFVESETELDEMATECARDCIAGVDIEGIIVASSTHRYHFPGLSQIVHKNLGLSSNIRAMDVGGACNGFMHALSIADNWMKCEGLNNIIVIGAENMSSILDMNDRNTCCLFGDGAGAVLLQRSADYGLLHFEHAVFSERYETLIAKKYVEMNGRAVFESSVKTFQEIITRVLEKTNRELTDVDLFVIHQANKRIFQTVCKNMNIDIAKMPFLAENFANTSAATIPMTLSMLDFQNKTIILAGFGAGFTTTASLLSYSNKTS